MKHTVHVVDYGMGNLLSVTRAFEHCGANAVLSSEARDFKNAERVVLPGVGAFSDGMKGLEERGLVGPLLEFAQKGGKLLGICLGMQMLLEAGEEFGRHRGLGLIPGKVTAISRQGESGKARKIPHMGWNGLYSARGPEGWRGTFLESVQSGEAVYFVHSYNAEVSDTKDCLAISHYDGPITAVVQKGNITGCQFHPEKSGKTGLKIIQQFLKS